MTEKLTYAAFRAQYEERHPASVPVQRTVGVEYPAWLRWATLAMFSCSALLSGVHTVPVVHRGIPPEIPHEVSVPVALGAFVAVELAIFLSAFAMRNRDRVSTWGVLFLSSVTALVANIYSVVTAYKAGDEGTLVVAVVIGLVAPLIALMSGKMFVNMHRAERAAVLREEDRFREAAVAWDAKVETAWTAYMERVQKSVQALDRVGQASLDVSNPSSRVEAYYKANPDALDASAREVAALLDVGKSTVYSVRSRVLNNGHGDDD